jgi:phospholipase C
VGWLLPPSKLADSTSALVARLTVQQFAAAASLSTATPIKYLVVIFQENQTFDHYFATYPQARNLPDEPPFHADAQPPRVNGLSPSLLTHNPNAQNPFRLDPRHALTCDQNHDYTAQQRAANGGQMDRFVEETEGRQAAASQYCPHGIVMSYFDGNTVTALWQYAQHFAMSDNAFSTTFGPSTVGALNLVAATTGGAVCGPSSGVYNTPGRCRAKDPPPTDANAHLKTGTVIADPGPFYDDCSPGTKQTKRLTAALVGPTIGNLLNAAGVSWGWFSGGFDHCTADHPTVAYNRLIGLSPAVHPPVKDDYDADHEPFQYFASTANPHHLPPSSAGMIGSTDRANHQYDLTDFWAAADAHHLPAVSFLKAPGYQNGHPGYSDPLDEQAFLVATINRLQQLPVWKNMAIILTWDDSDGWYDHVRPPLVNHSHTPLDVACGGTSDGVPGRCGYGPRLPYLVISPYAKPNFVDHSLLDQTSTIRFIEDNWLHGRRLDPHTFDARAGAINAMFDFAHPRRERLILNPLSGENR